MFSRTVIRLSVLLVVPSSAVFGQDLRSGLRQNSFYDNHVLVTGGSEAAAARVFDIKSYDAIGDGVAMDTTAVQQAIDACHQAGGGIVRVPPGDFQIGTIRLKSNVTLSLDHAARLLGSRDIADYPVEGLDDPREGGPHCLINAKDATKAERCQS